MFVDPTDSGVTTPAATVATASFEEAQLYVNVPVPVACELKVREPPIQTALLPVIAPAIGLSLIETFTEPVITLTQEVAALVASTVYVPAAVICSKVSPDPMPARVVPVAEPSFQSS